VNKTPILLEAARRGLLSEKNLSALQEGRLSGFERDDKIAEALQAIREQSDANAGELSKLVQVLSKALQSQKAPTVNVSPNVKVDTPEPNVTVEAVIQPADVKVVVQKPKVKMLHVVRDEWGELIGFRPEYE